MRCKFSTSVIRPYSLDNALPALLPRPLLLTTCASRKCTLLENRSNRAVCPPNLRPAYVRKIRPFQDHLGTEHNILITRSSFSRLLHTQTREKVVSVSNRSACVRNNLETSSSSFWVPNPSTMVSFPPQCGPTSCLWGITCGNGTSCGRCLIVINAHAAVRDVHLATIHTSS